MEMALAAGREEMQKVRCAIGGCIMHSPCSACWWHLMATVFTAGRVARGAGV